MAFTWFDKFTATMEKIPGEELQNEFLLAVVRYGAYGEEPTFSNDWMPVVFEGIREDVDNSIKSHQAQVQSSDYVQFV